MTNGRELYRFRIPTLLSLSTLSLLGNARRDGRARYLPGTSLSRTDDFASAALRADNRGGDAKSNHVRIEPIVWFGWQRREIQEDRDC